MFRILARRLSPGLTETQYSIGPGRELHMECIHGRLLVRVPR